jgi:hypothetical protein
MTNQAILSIFDYLCNEARNSAHSLFGLTELEGETAADLALRACIEGSRASTDRLLRSIDDVRELLAGESPASETLEEFDAASCLGETVDLLNLASRQPGRRIVLESGSEPVIVRQDRRVMEQVLARVLDAGLKLIRSGELRAGARPGTAGNGVRFEILLPICDLAARLVEWLNVDPEQIAFQNNDDVALKVPVMVAGRRLRALGGTAEFACQAPAPTRLAIYLPSQPDHMAGAQLGTLAAVRSCGSVERPGGGRLRRKLRDQRASAQERKCVASAHGPGSHRRGEVAPLRLGADGRAHARNGRI